jgi:hypothetical protein
MGDEPMAFAAFPALCGTVVVAASVAAGLAGFGSHVVENAAAPIEASRSTSLSADAEPVDASHTITLNEDRVSAADVAIVDVASPETHLATSTETRTEPVAAEGKSDPVENNGKQVANSVEILDECFVAEICIDQYLWSMYQRAPKVDTIRVPEQIKVTVKTRVVVKTVTKLVARTSHEKIRRLHKKQACR